MSRTLPESLYWKTKRTTKFGIVLTWRSGKEEPRRDVWTPVCEQRAPVRSKQPKLALYQFSLLGINASLQVDVRQEQWESSNDIAT